MDTFHERFSNLLDKQYFNFAAAHFLIFADGTREPLHGHNYRAELEIEGEDLDRAGLVADFIQVKPLFKRACDALDHKVLLPTHCAALRVAREGGSVTARWRDERFSFPEADVVLLELENTSSELLARHLCDETLTLLQQALPRLQLRRIAVSLSESPGQSARCERVRLSESDRPHLSTLAVPFTPRTFS
ncbi:MAG: 6-carboxytetrahydropterin synthase [Planctomycetes bacterium]|nr:6-carboxytetrahydropterin synthase [Planctomycetota bacterium]